MPDPLGHDSHLGGDWGYSWWRLSSDASRNQINKISYNISSQFLGDSVGFYPVANVDWHHYRDYGCLHDPDGQMVHAHHKYEIGFEDLINGLNHTQNVHDNPPEYDIYIDNCTDEAIAAGKAAGVTLPNAGHPSKPEVLGWGVRDIIPSN
jgi:hypothetical protein